MPDQPADAPSRRTPHSGSRRARIIGIVTMLVIAGAVALSLLHPRSVVPVPQQARFVGFAHGTPETVPKTFATNDTAFLREWYATGTNVALFSITNQQRYPVILYPDAGFFGATNAAQPRYNTVLVNADDGYGVFLRPGQAATVAVAVLPGQGAGRVRFGYTPDYRHFVPQTIEMVRGIVSHQPAGFHTEWFFSDPLEP